MNRFCYVLSNAEDMFMLPYACPSSWPVQCTSASYHPIFHFLGDSFTIDTHCVRSKAGEILKAAPLHLYISSIELHGNVHSIYHHFHFRPNLFYLWSSIYPYLIQPQPFDYIETDTTTEYSVLHSWLDLFHDMYLSGPLMICLLHF